jgi:hypothetical protein
MHRRGLVGVVMTLIGAVLMSAALIIASVVLQSGDRTSPEVSSPEFDAFTLAIKAGEIDTRSLSLYDIDDTEALMTPVEPDPTTTTIPSDFYPEDANLSDCVGLVEKPGCGSKARGGWRQTMVFVVVLAGLALIGWRISVGIRKNRASPPPKL